MIPENEVTIELALKGVRQQVKGYLAPANAAGSDAEKMAGGVQKTLKNRVVYCPTCNEVIGADGFFEMNARVFNKHGELVYGGDIVVSDETFALGYRTSNATHETRHGKTRKDALKGENPGRTISAEADAEKSLSEGLQGSLYGRSTQYDEVINQSEDVIKAFTQKAVSDVIRIYQTSPTVSKTRLFSSAVDGSLLALKEADKRMTQVIGRIETKVNTVEKLNLQMAQLNQLGREGLLEAAQRLKGDRAAITQYSEKHFTASRTGYPVHLVEIPSGTLSIPMNTPELRSIYAKIREAAMGIRAPGMTKTGSLQKDLELFQSAFEELIAKQTELLNQSTALTERMTPSIARAKAAVAKLKEQDFFTKDEFFQIKNDLSSLAVTAKEIRFPKLKKKPTP